MKRDLELAASYLSSTTHKLSNAIDEAGSDIEAWEQIASEFRDLAKGAEEFITVLRRTPPGPLTIPEMAVYS